MPQNSTKTGFDPGSAFVKLLRDEWTMMNLVVKKTRRQEPLGRANRRINRGSEEYTEREARVLNRRKQRERRVE